MSFLWDIPCRGHGNVKAPIGTYGPKPMKSWHSGVAKVVPWRGGKI